MDKFYEPYFRDEENEAYVVSNLHKVMQFLGATFETVLPLLFLLCHTRSS